MTTGASILERIIKPESGDLSTELAQYILNLDFAVGEHARYSELARKAQDGHLTPEEEGELDEFVAANAFLTILQSKARTSLKKHNPAA